MTDTAGPGHNNPPADDYLKRLESEIEDLLDLEADKDARTAGRAEERAERQVIDPSKGKTAGGGANARVVMVPKYRVTSWPKLQQSLGPLGNFFSVESLDKPLKLWAAIAQAKEQEREAIPGVEFYQEAETKTSATRS